MSKNPFELRYNTLELARQHLMDEYYSQMELYRESVQGPPSARHSVPTYPASEVVMDLAAKFKAFVDAS